MGLADENGQFDVIPPAALDARYWGDTTQSRTKCSVPPNCWPDAHFGTIVGSYVFADKVALAAPLLRIGAVSRGMQTRTSQMCVAMRRLSLCA